MANSDVNLAERSGNLVEAYKTYDPRIIFFYFVIAGMLVTLAVGLAYQQLTKVSEYAVAERQQNQRRVIFPGPRGNIYDRNGKVLVENKHRFAVLLHLDELKSELRKEYYRIHRNFREAVDRKEIPTDAQLRQIARVSLVQRYLDQVNQILGRNDKVDPVELSRHFDRRLLLPYTLVDNLKPEEFAQVMERLPVNSPLEVYAFNVRHYPYGSAAAQTLGYVRSDPQIDAGDFPGHDLGTFKMPGTKGINGLEKWFNSTLQGEPGGRIYRVDPTGYRINPPLEVRTPKQGKHLTTTLDIDLQLAAEEAIADQRGAAVALDVATGEVLVLASMPSYNLNSWTPRMDSETYKEIQEKNAEFNNATQGLWPPGSTFKILTSIAALRRGTVTIDQPITECAGVIYVGRRAFVCDNRRGQHGHVLLPEAVARSCDIYYYEAGKLTTPEIIAAEARRFHMDRATGIELPFEARDMIVAEPAWKERHRKEQGPWSLGDTYNTSIGQGFLWFTPLQMACFAASVARNEVWTKPTLVHRPDAPRQRTDPIGLTPQQRAALLEGMEGCTVYGTARGVFAPKAPLHIPGVRVGGKTGTAQIPGKRNAAWFICFAPFEKPEIAIAVMIEGDEAGETLEGGRYAAPVAGTILKKYFEKKANPAPKAVVSRTQS